MSGLFLIFAVSNVCAFTWSTAVYNRASVSCILHSTLFRSPSTRNVQGEQGPWAYLNCLQMRQASVCVQSRPTNEYGPRACIIAATATKDYRCALAKVVVREIPPETLVIDCFANLSPLQCCAGIPQY